MNEFLLKEFVFINGLSVGMYSCESWTQRKKKRKKIDTFRFWIWRWLPRVPWTARITNQSEFWTK